MNKKLVLAAFVGLLTSLGLWFVLSEDGRGRGATPAASSGAQPAAESGADELPAAAELAPAAAPVESERAALAERTDASAAAVVLATDHETFPTENARWIEVSVVLPRGVPPGDAPALIGFASKRGGEYEEWSTNKLSEQLGIDDSFATEVENEHHWSRRTLAGSVRMPFPPEAKEGVLFVQSRYLHLDPFEVALATTTRVTIEPELGAYVTGRCVFPPGRSAAPQDITVDFDGRAREDGLMGFARPDGRDARVRADLTFELRALSASKKYALAGKAKGFVGHFELSFEVSPGERREVTLEFQPGATLAGFVRGDGQPIADAKVGLEARRMPWSDDLSVQTDAEGSFLLEGVAAGKVTLVASKDGWRETKSERMEVVEGQRVDGIELVLDAGQRIRGTVLWPDGTPVEGAEVRASKLRQRRVQSLTRCSSEADGSFVLGGLEEAPVEVFARHAPRDAAKPAETFAEEGGGRGFEGMVNAAGEWIASLASVAPGTSDLVLTLQEPHAVQGLVVDDTGAPVRSFHVSALPVGRPDNAPEEVEQSFEAEDGAFTLALGLPGTWSLRASVDERASESVELAVPQAGAELRLVLPRGSAVSGVVLDPAGVPVADASVHVSASAQEAAFAAFGGGEVTTGSDGRFELASVKSGGFAHATHDDWAASEQVALELVPGESLVDVVLRLRLGARITGEVFDAEGKPQAGQNVNCASGAMAAMAFGFGAERSSASDGAGRFAFEHVTPGKVTVTATPSEEELMARFQGGEGDEQAMLAMLSAMRSASVEVVDGGEAHVVLGAKPKLPVRVHGRVSEAGSPLAEKQVFAFAEGGALLQGMKLARTDAGGRYELVLDRPGDYVFGVGDGFSEGTGAQFYVAVPEIAEFEQDLALPLGRIAGVVLGPDGPASGVRLRLVSAEGLMGLEDLSESSRASSAADGAFVFEHLQPGAYALHVGSEFGNDSGDARFGQLVVDGIQVEKDRAVDGLVVRLAKPGKLTGIVRDVSGAAQSGVTIFVRDAAGRAISASGCMSDAAGRFTYDGIAPGRVTASARGSRSASVESAAVEIRSGETSHVELTVAEGTFLHVSLLGSSQDDEAQPVRARLCVRDEAGRRVDDLMSMEDVMGLLSEGFSSRERRVGPLAPGKYTLIATTLDGKDAKKSVLVEAGQGERIVKLRLK